MNVLLLLLLVAAVAAGAVWYLRRRQASQAERREAARKAAPRPDPLADVHGNEDLLYGLRPGDVIDYHSSDYLVRGSIHFDEDGYRWSEHLISDEREQQWLCVEDDEGLRVTLWQRLPPTEVEGEPGAATVRHGNVVYRLQEDGRASFTAEGTTGTAPSGTARYVDYEGPDGELLSWEQFGRSWELSTGRTVLPRALDVYPRAT